MKENIRKQAKETVEACFKPNIKNHNLVAVGGQPNPTQRHRAVILPLL